MNRVYGAKYNASLSLKEIAAHIRADLKAAVETDDLSQARYSVRIERGSMYRAINVTVSDVSALVYVHNQKRLAAEIDDSDALYAANSETRARYSLEAVAFMAKVEAIVAAYNHDGSDIQTDYFDVHFYANVGFDSDYEQAAREREIQDIRDERRNAAERAEVRADMAKTGEPACARCGRYFDDAGLCYVCSAADLAKSDAAQESFVAFLGAAS